MGCDKQARNMDGCSCTYPGCPRKGNCCECVTYHRRMDQLPGCFFPPAAEATFDRSYRHFARLHCGH